VAARASSNLAGSSLSWAPSQAKSPNTLVTDLCDRLVIEFQARSRSAVTGVEQT